MAEQKGSDDASTVLSRNRSATDRVREVAKWLIVVFGAIGGVLLTGTQLSDIGATDGTDRTMAILGMVVGVVGAGIALAATVRVLLPISISLKDLAEGKSGSKVKDSVREWAEDLRDKKWPRTIDSFVEKDPTLLGDYGPKIEDFHVAWEEKWTRQKKARQNYEETGRTWALKAELEKAEAEVERIDKTGATFLSFALATRVRQRMKGAVVAIFIGGAMVAAGITMFSFATNHDDAPASGSAAGAVPKRPSWVSVELSPHGAEVLTKRVGDGCPMPLNAIALDGEPDALELVSIPSADCAATRFTLTEGMGVVVSREAVELPPGPNGP